MGKLKLHTPDFTDANIAGRARLFPGSAAAAAAECWRAVDVRQAHRLKPPDAIIRGTAFERSVLLVTSASGRVSVRAAMRSYIGTDPAPRPARDARPHHHLDPGARRHRGVPPVAGPGKAGCAP
jgi:hypothetical protein